MRALGDRPLTPRQRSLAEIAVLLLPLAPLGCTESASGPMTRDVRVGAAAGGAGGLAAAGGAAAGAGGADAGGC